MSLTELLSGALTPGNIDAIASRLGIENDQAKKALGAALPALMNGLKKNTSTPEGADLLNSALEDHGDDADNVVEIVTNGKAKKGDKIAHHILGSNTDSVTQMIAEKSGLDVSKASSLLQGLGPVLMGALGKAKKNNNLSAGDLQGLLSGESGGLMKVVGGFLDQDGDGDFDIKDGISMAMNFLKK